MRVTAPLETASVPVPWAGELALASPSAPQRAGYDAGHRRAHATLAVATPAQAFVLAGLVRLSSRRPVLVITPTGATAEQLAHDLAAFTDGPAQSLAPDQRRPAPGGQGIHLFPAWETLPFERVSPDVATMGRRLRLLWALGGAGVDRGRGGDPDRSDDAAGPEIVVAPIKAVLQRLGPWRTAARPVEVHPGTGCRWTSWSPA